MSGRPGATGAFGAAPVVSSSMNAAVEFSQGFMNALVAGDDRILGFTMIGSEAGEVMAAVQNAMLARLP